MSYIRPHRSAQAKGPGLPRVERSRVPRGLASNPLFQCNQCPDVVGNVPAASWWLGDRGLVPTQWGTGMNWYFSQVSYLVPRSGMSKHWSRAVLFKTPGSVIAMTMCGDSGYGNERDLKITASAKPEGYFWPGTSITLTGTTTLQPNTLYMICMTYSGGTATLYLNGVQEAQSTGHSDNPFYVATTKYGSNGQNGGDGGATLAGYGANVGWTAQEVMDLWRAPFGHLIFQDEPAFWVPDAGLGALLSSSITPITATGAFTFADMTIAGEATYTAPSSGVHGVLRRRTRRRLWNDVPQDLKPVVALAEEWADESRVQQAVNDALARYAALSARASAARRDRLIDDLKRAIVHAVERAAEADDEEALIALL